MPRIGLTGGIGSGKSTVAGLLADRGATTIDADQLAREVVEPGTPGFAAVRARFGSAVITADGRLDRAALGALVFADPAQLADLNAIVHPLVAERTAALMAAVGPDEVVVYDVPLLVENRMADQFDVVVVVSAPVAVRLGRLVDRGLSEADSLARIEQQATDEERAAVADYVVDNSGDLAALKAAVADLWPRLASGQPGLEAGSVIG